MKRSEINAIIVEGIEFCRRQNFHLPPWAFWTPAQWASAGTEADEIRSAGLGWDVTDFGSGDFRRCGLLLFTLRNGVPGAAGGKDYCEKLLLIAAGQVTPTHYHVAKMEDIINRGGGRLVMRLWNAAGNALDERSSVRVSVDGICRQLDPGDELVLQPGESVTLPPRLYHQFYGQAGGGMVLGGEVSRVNDDAGDNYFLTPLPRFPAVEEDAPPLHLLCNEYPPAQVRMTKFE